MTKTKSIKSITEAGIFVAVYCLMALVTRYLITGTDSMLYYIWPIPIAIYTVRHKFIYGLTTTLAAIVLSFIFANPIYVLMLIMPNLIIGFVFSLLELKSKQKIINYLVMFIICLIADFLSVYAYEVITGVSYWQDTIDLMSTIFDSFVDSEYDSIYNMVKILSVATLIIDSVIKVVFMYLLFGIIVRRLKLIDNYQFKAKIPLRYHWMIAGGYLLLLIVSILLTNILLTKDLIVIEILHIIVISILFLSSCYLLYQFTIFLRLKLNQISNGYFILIIILSFILFPISIVMGLILNFINWNFLKETIK